TAAKPSSGATSASSRKFAWRSRSRAPYRGVRRAPTLATAAPSASRPRRRPSGSLAARIRSAWPPPPRVASTCRLPAAGASIATTSSARTGTWLTATGSVVTRSDPETADGVGESGRIVHLASVFGPSIGGPDLAVIAHADDQRLGLDAHLGSEVGR